MVEPQEANCKIVPIRVVALDQLDLPRPVPVLHPPLAHGSIADVMIGFDIDEALYAIAPREPADEAVAMFVNAFRQIGGAADVDGAVAPAGEDVDMGGHRKTVSAASGSSKNGIWSVLDLC